jgi:homoserine kinase
MWCTNRVPHARGLGSSAAATVAGVLSGRALAGAEPDEEEALALATAIEGHPDNAAAALMGGLTIAWTDRGGAHAARMEPSPEVGVVVLVPEAGLSTATARGVLPAAVPHADAAHSAGRAALLVEALTRRPDLLLAATEDRLHQDYRAGAMPATAALVSRLRAAGVAAAVSGAGPSVLVLAAGEPAGLDVPDGWTSHRLAVDRSGAQVRVAAG